MPQYTNKPPLSASIPATSYVTAHEAPLSSKQCDDLSPNTHAIYTGKNVCDEDDKWDSDEEEELRHCMAWCANLLPQDQLLLGLPPNSYTAYRMFYCMPEYLDKSSQILVIGPARKPDHKTQLSRTIGSSFIGGDADNGQHAAPIQRAHTLKSIPPKINSFLESRSSTGGLFNLADNTDRSSDINYGNLSSETSLNEFGDSFYFEPKGVNTTSHSRAFYNINESHLNELLSLSKKSLSDDKSDNKDLVHGDSMTIPLSSERVSFRDHERRAHTVQGINTGSLTHRHTVGGTEFYPFRHNHQKEIKTSLSDYPQSFTSLKRAPTRVPSIFQRAATINNKVLSQKEQQLHRSDSDYPDYTFSHKLRTNSRVKTPRTESNLLQNSEAADPAKPNNEIGLAKDTDSKLNKGEYDSERYLNKLYRGDASVLQYPPSSSSSSSSNQSYVTAQENLVVSGSDKDNNSSDDDDALYKSAYEVIGKPSSNLNLTKDGSKNLQNKKANNKSDAKDSLFRMPTSLLNTLPIYSHSPIRRQPVELRGLLSSARPSSLSSSETVTQFNAFSNKHDSKTAGTDMDGCDLFKHPDQSESPLALEPESVTSQTKVPGHVKFTVPSPVTTHEVSFIPDGPIAPGVFSKSLDRESIDQHTANNEAESMFPEGKNDGAYERLMQRWKSAKRYAKKQAKEGLKLEGGASQAWRYLGRKTPGEIIRIEKLLVLIKYSKNKSLPTYFNDNEPSTDTRVLERWKEYIVVARVTGDYDSPILLQLYSNRKISAVDLEMDANSDNRKLNQARPKFALKLNRHLLKVNFYSSLDKTLALWLTPSPETNENHSSSESEKKKGSKQGTIIYIFKGKTVLSSYKWLAFFNEILGRSRSRTMSVQIPALQVYVDLRIPWDSLDSLERVMKRMLHDREVNDGVCGIGMNDVLHHYVMLKVVWTLYKKPEFRSIIDRWLKEEKLGFCWKRYDRLEWAQKSHNYKEIRSSDIMTRIYDLQLRTIKPAPTDVTYENDDSSDSNGNKGVKISEPIPIEGYLHRLTSINGKSRQRWGKLYARKLYFSTHDNLLFFTRPSQVTPLLEKPNNNSDEESDDRDGLHLTGDMQLIRPYKTTVDGSDISWVKPLRQKDRRGLSTSMSHGARTDFKRRDRYALNNMRRRVMQIVKADGFINLANIKFVRPVQRQRYTTDVMVGHGSNGLASVIEEHGNNLDETNGKEDEIGQYADNEVFELLLENNIVIRLQAANEECQRLWVTRLSELVKYWKQFMVEETQRKINLRLRNLANLGIKEDCYAQFGDSAQKWETFKADADPQIYNMDAVSWSRSIAMKGLLYSKSKKHSSFRQYYGVLCHGHLIIYAMHRRTAVGISVPKVEYRKFKAIDLKGCYTYSGNIAQSDLLNLDNSVDRNNPGVHRVPRVYPDGWRSSEEDTQRCFVLWFGRKRAVAVQSDHKDGLQTNTKVKVVNRLGVLGNSMVFLTRARVERDLWVTTLNTEIEKVFEPDYDDVSIS
ncbi:hypothetical protein NADFUDRAFT_82714 [Nadsonia fulvescens var. elongata DSM 6958]|uniref:PH domain-containing protein n=1 Tax=Nadsonia fulvescens var. elongata DSM 6958 TaxID=857566 RepID=A0A1E3PJW1_9ASCO|nr:hypothetical protein NADFUDRAFT_82714 [Nadsonia fulvescens var. elongata DSM 6958]